MDYITRIWQTQKQKNVETQIETALCIITNNNSLLFIHNHKKYTIINYKLIADLQIGYRKT